MKFGAREQHPNTRRVLVLADAYDIDVYDAEFVALADELGVPLLTADEKSLADHVPDHLILRLSSFQGLESSRFRTASRSWAAGNR
jgi:hypothetical protein